MAQAVRRSRQAARPAAMSTWRRARLRHGRSTPPRPACAPSCRRYRPECSRSTRLAYELVYGKGLTPFLRLAQNAGVDAPGRRCGHAGRAGRRGLRLVAWRAARHAPADRPDDDSAVVTPDEQDPHRGGRCRLHRPGPHGRGARQRHLSRCRPIVDPSPAAQAHADAAGVPLYASLAELFAKDKPDGVVLATPNHLHVPHALECIARGRADAAGKADRAHAWPRPRRLVRAADAARREDPDRPPPRAQPDHGQGPAGGRLRRARASWSP